MPSGLISPPAAELFDRLVRAIAGATELFLRTTRSLRASMSKRMGNIATGALLTSKEATVVVETGDCESETAGRESDGRSDMTCIFRSAESSITRSSVREVEMRAEISDVAVSDALDVT